MQQIASAPDRTRVTGSLAAHERWMNGAKCSRSTRWLLFIASVLGTAMSGAAAGDGIFARVCSEREVTVITLIEDHGAAAFIEPSVGNETLSRAGLMLMEAREECYRGRVAEAIALYDKIATMLGPVSAQRTR
ncbi:MAG: hypothetical protein QOI40_5754 [Alphaproteobacteria bacterium]|nr:hypothetical protein [Alphaproteobacteria bacterium]